MNKGINGEIIFETAEFKQKFLEILQKNTKIYGIKIIAYCIMQNHFHIILKNENNKLSEFMKKVEGDFGLHYRKVKGGKGYVFTTRFKSTLIQADNYLKTSVVYVLLNPVRSAYTKFIDDYRWSSYGDCFNNDKNTVCDCKELKRIFEDISSLNDFIKNFKTSKLNVCHTRFGDILSEKEYIKHAESLTNKRKNNNGNILRRQNEKAHFDYSKVIKNIEKKFNISLLSPTSKSPNIKKIRRDILIYLRETTPMTYLEIQKIPIFKTMKLNSLINLYYRNKKRKHDKNDTPSPL